MTKQADYKNLVQQRKDCSACSDKGYLNQFKLGCDTDQIGNYSTWANDLDADLMIVAQDFSNQEIYARDKGQIEPRTLAKDAKASDYSTATNFYLRELTKLIGRDIGLPTGNTGKGIFITNAVLCMKPGEMNAANPGSVIANCGTRFLKPLIDIVKPKAIVTLGVVPARAVLKAYQSDDPTIGELLKLPFGQLSLEGPISLGIDGPRLFAMYHPGRLGQVGRQRAEPNNGSGWELMQGDWLRLRAALA
ncbi:MAG: uracil-DNA glycosylase family protein [Flavobacteriales bacterium]|nr:hypothetical protein [Flavobacteriales bacterium]